MRKRKLRYAIEAAVITLKRSFQKINNCPDPSIKYGTKNLLVAITFKRSRVASK
jgi:hypothetical protein